MHSVLYRVGSHTRTPTLQHITSTGTTATRAPTMCHVIPHQRQASPATGGTTSLLTLCLGSAMSTNMTSPRSLRLAHSGELEADHPVTSILFSRRALVLLDMICLTCLEESSTSQIDILPPAYEELLAEPVNLCWEAFGKTFSAVGGRMATCVGFADIS